MNIYMLIYQTFNDIEEMSGGVLTAGTYSLAFRFESGGEEINSGGESASIYGYRWVPKNKRAKVTIGGDAIIRTNVYRFVSSGQINVQADNVQKLFYYDMPCPDPTDGFSYVLKYPNKHIDCALEEPYFTQCTVYNRPYKCRNSSEALLPAITSARQIGYLPPKDRTRKIPKIR